MAIDPTQQPIMVQVGQRIAAQRHSHGMTLHQLHTITHIPLGTLSRLEHAALKNGPRMDLLMTLAKAFNIPLEALIQPCLDDVRAAITEA